MAKLLLSGPVGSYPKDRNNAQEDVDAVRQRLRALGFSWISQTGLGNEPDFVRTIELFQAICKGQTKFTRGNGVNGKIIPLDFTHEWLAASNAPGWVKIYGKKGKGWSSTVDQNPSGGKKEWDGGTPYRELNGGYGTTWIYRVVTEVAMAYSKCRISQYPDMWVRDCAPKKGGRADFHGSHETGLDIDMRLPLRPIMDHMPVSPLHGPRPHPMWTFLKTKKDRKEQLYREALEYQLLLLNNHARVLKIFFIDEPMKGVQNLTRKYGKVRIEEDHENHIHIRIQPPTRVPGQIE